MPPRQCCWLYIAVAKRQGVSPDKLRGTIQNDILKEYLTRNTFIYPPTPSMRIVSDIIGFCSQNMPRYNTISISGYHMREAGATAAQEIAFTLADALAYVDGAVKRGLDVDEFAANGAADAPAAHVLEDARDGHEARAHLGIDAEALQNVVAGPGRHDRGPAGRRDRRPQRLRGGAPEPRPAAGCGAGGTGAPSTYSGRHGHCWLR